jgi:endonuclease/exonuclease/phosphatase (EEP) superfamily protein YafD
LLRWAALSLGFGCAIAALAGQGGRWNATFDVLNHFAPFWLVGALLALGLWLSTGRAGRLTPAFSALAILAAGLQVAPELFAPRSLAAARPGAETLKIIQFNLWENNIDQAGTLKWILAQNADIVVVQEALGTPKIVRGLRTLYPYRRTCQGVTYCETEIFSKRPPMASAGLFDPFGLPAAWVEFDGAGGPFIVLGMHAMWPIPGGPQQTQSAFLARIMASLPKDRMIVTGDFNSTPWSFALRRQDHLFGIERRTHALASWPGWLDRPLKFGPPIPFLPIDQVYAGPGWRTLSVVRGPRLGSDHYPVIVTLQADGPR